MSVEHMNEYAAVDIIDQYRESKKKMEALAASARKTMQERYTNLLADAARIRSEFHANFGTYPELPASVKAFTTGEAAKKKAAPASEAQANGKKIGGLRRSLNAALKNNDESKAATAAAQLAALGVTVDISAPDLTVREEDIFPKE